MKYIDLTHTFTQKMPVFPGDPKAELITVANINDQGFSNQQIFSGMHTGTHMDGPAHMINGASLLSEYSPERFFGRGVIIDVRGRQVVEEEDLNGVDIKPGDIVLVCFGWSDQFKQDKYYLNYPEVSAKFAERLADYGISSLGVDTPAPDKAPYLVHQILFKRDVFIIENLTNLEGLIGKSFEVISLPVKFQADSAFCRVVAKILI